MRLFTALALPDYIADPLLGIMGGVPGARWQSREQLHLTLRFIGETDGGEAGAIHDALQAIAIPGFPLDVCSVGVFHGKKSSSLWAGVAPSDTLHQLNRKIESALQRAGCAPDGRKFAPHITLARMKSTPDEKIAEYLTAHALFHAGRFPVTEFILYSSQLSPNGSSYRPEARFPLTPA